MFISYGEIKINLILEIIRILDHSSCVYIFYVPCLLSGHNPFECNKAIICKLL